MRSALSSPAIPGRLEALPRAALYGEARVRSRYAHNPTSTRNGSPFASRCLGEEGCIDVHRVHVFAYCNDLVVAEFKKEMIEIVVDPAGFIDAV